MTALTPAAPARVNAGPKMRRHELLHVLGGSLRTPRGMAGFVLTMLVVLLAVIGPFVAPHGSTDFVTLPFAEPNHTALLGGDVLGRDVLSRLLDGGWQLLIMAVAATAIGIGAGSRRRCCSRLSARLAGQHHHADGRRAAGLPTTGLRAAAGVSHRPEAVAASPSSRPIRAIVKTCGSRSFREASS